MNERHEGTRSALRHLGVLVGLVLFVLVAGFLLTGSPTAGVGAILGMTAIFLTMYAFYTVIDD